MKRKVLSFLRLETSISIEKYIKPYETIYCANHYKNNNFMHFA